MSARLDHDEAQELLGAYALDAVDANEGAAIEAHLRGCPRCRSEVAGHREAAALLVDTHLDPPGSLWDRVAAGLEEVAPPLDLARYRPPASGRSRAGWSWLTAAAAAIALVLGAGGLAYQEQRDELDDVQAAIGEHELAVAALAAFDDPAARAATLRAGDGSLQLRAALLPDGTGYLLADRLPSVADDRTYQLWAMLDGEPVSAGVLGADPGVVRFRVPEGASALAISVERRDGADEPTLPAALTGLVGA